MSQFNCFIFVCKKSKLKEGLKRWTNQAFWFLSSILTSLKNILTPRSHACFPCRTGGHTHTTPVGKTHKVQNQLLHLRLCACSIQQGTCNFVPNNVRGVLRKEIVGTHAALYMLYVPGTETFAANGCHYRKQGFAKIRVFTCGAALLLLWLGG